MCNIYMKYTIVFVIFNFYFKVPIKNITIVILKEDLFELIHKYHNIINNHSRLKTIYHQVKGYIMQYICLAYFLQEFCIHKCHIWFRFSISKSLRYGYNNSININTLISMLLNTEHYFLTLERTTLKWGRS